MNDTLVINGVTYGPPIPHDPTPVTLSDGTKVSPVCPWPDVVGVVVFRGGSFIEADTMGVLFWNELGHEYTITAYRLPADHHAYGDRKSGMGEPDCYVNQYKHFTSLIPNYRKYNQDDWGESFRIGIWRIYKKGESK